MAAVLVLVIAGFSGMFFWANKISFEPVFTGLSHEDAASIVEKLKSEKIPYRVSAGGSTVLVPDDRLYDIRLLLAGAGLPRGGSVGYELFDKSDFGTTEFAQKLNYQRALQGELARTIREFNEVLDARVMIVMPKESVFIEEEKPPSASVLLKLKANISSSKVNAVVHLVASSVEGLTAEMVTVVDTSGKVLSKGLSGGESDTTPGTHLEYKIAYEKNMTQRIQSMLEKIVGKDKAIVRVSTDMDFNQVDINEEVYDPDAQAVRSSQNVAETSERNLGGGGGASTVNPVTTPGSSSNSEVCQKKDETVNYEISRTIRRTVKPAGSVSRLSVAAVLDGTYIFETDDEGIRTRKYIERTKKEIDQFTTIIKNAMGFSEDRGDQVSIESFPFHYIEDMAAPVGIDAIAFLRKFHRPIINVILIMVLFVFVVLPLIKSMKEIKTSVVESAALLPSPDGEGMDLLTGEGRKALPDLSKMTSSEKAIYLAGQDFKKTINILRLWLNEEG